MHVLQPQADRNPPGLGPSPFARHYLGNHYCFLFLLLLRCFSSQGSPPGCPGFQSFRLEGCPIPRIRCKSCKTHIRQNVRQLLPHLKPNADTFNKTKQPTYYLKKPFSLLTKGSNPIIRALLIVLAI